MPLSTHTHTHTHTHTYPDDPKETPVRNACTFALASFMFALVPSQGDAPLETQSSKMGEGVAPRGKRTSTAESELTLVDVFHLFQICLVFVLLQLY